MPARHEGNSVLTILAIGWGGNLVELLTLACVLYAAVMGPHRLHRRFDEPARCEEDVLDVRHPHHH